jgi:MarR family transcriptional regulator, lower aerobic nicotinate degradation pathway regulator
MVRHGVPDFVCVATRLELHRDSVNNLASINHKSYRQGMTDASGYRLDDQIGYILRRVTQRHLALFAAAIPEITTTQFAVLARLSEIGPVSQNHLGRATAMDAATIKGVVDRLAKLGYLATNADPNDRRRLTVSLTEAGDRLFTARAATALAISAETVAPLTEDEAQLLKTLLSKLT